MSTEEELASQMRGFSAVIKSAADSIMALGAAATGGKASLSQTMAIMSSVVQKTLGSMMPTAVGIFTNALSLATSVAEKNITTQESLAKSGASFGGSLTDMRLAAGKAYLSLDELAATVSKNKDVFNTMGGDVQSGVKRFTQIQNTLLSPGSETARNLATLGYSMADAADLTASYMRSQGSMNKQELQDSKYVAAAVQQYAQELDVLSRITGKNREELQKKLDQENAEAQWKQFLETVSPEQANKLRQGAQNAIAQGGQGAMDAFKAMAMGFPPMTEAGRLYQATQQAGVEALQEYNQRARDESISSAEAGKLNRATLAKAIANGAGDMERLRSVLQADALAGGKLSQSFADAQQIQNAFMQDGKMMSEQEIAAKLELMAKDAERSKSEAEVTKRQQQAMQDLTNQILMKMLPALNFLLDITTRAASYLGNLVFSNWGSISASIQEAFDYIKASWGEFFEPILIKGSAIFRKISEDMGPVMGDLGDIFRSIIDLIAKYILPIVSPIVNGIMDALFPFWDAFKSIIKVIKNILAGDFGKAGEYFESAITSIWEAIKTFWVGLKDAALKLINPASWFKNETPPTLTVPSSAPVSQVPSATAVLAPTTTAASTPVTTASAPVSTASSSGNASTDLLRLNNVMNDVLRILREVAENTKRNVSATQALGGNMYPVQ